eukprot:Clim_evm4s183 gene=Clim_evmTU4s183
MSSESSTPTIKVEAMDTESSSESKTNAGSAVKRSLRQKILAKQEAGTRDSLGSVGSLPEEMEETDSQRAEEILKSEVLTSKRALRAQARSEAMSGTKIDAMYLESFEGPTQPSDAEIFGDMAILPVEKPKRKKQPAAKPPPPPPRLLSTAAKASAAVAYTAASEPGKYSMPCVPPALQPPVTLVQRAAPGEDDRAYQSRWGISSNIQGAIDAETIALMTQAGGTLFAQAQLRELRNSGSPMKQKQPGQILQPGELPGDLSSDSISSISSDRAKDPVSMLKIGGVIGSPAPYKSNPPLGLALLNEDLPSGSRSPMLPRYRRPTGLEEQEKAVSHDNIASVAKRRRNSSKCLGFHEQTLLKLQAMQEQAELGEVLPGAEIPEKDARRGYVPDRMDHADEIILDDSDETPRQVSLNNRKRGIGLRNQYESGNIARTQSDVGFGGPLGTSDDAFDSFLKARGYDTRTALGQHSQSSGNIAGMSRGLDIRRTGSTTALNKPWSGTRSKTPPLFHRRKPPEEEVDTRATDRESAALELSLSAMNVNDPDEAERLRWEFTETMRILGEGATFKIGDAVCVSSSIVGDLKLDESDDSDDFLDEEEVEEEEDLMDTDKKSKKKNGKNNNTKAKPETPDYIPPSRILWAARLRALGQDKVFVHYEGWGPELDEWIPVSRVHPREAGSLDASSISGSKNSKKNEETKKGGKKGAMAAENERKYHGKVLPMRVGPMGLESDEHWQNLRKAILTHGGDIMATQNKTLDGSFGKMVLDPSRRTALVSEPRTMLHCCTCDEPELWHPERPERIASILAGFEKAGLLDQCTRILPREATFDELRLCHSEEHIDRYARFPYRLPVSWPDLEVMECGGPGIACDTVFNKFTSPYAARLSAGALLNVVESVVKGETRNGFAVVRPPGHHADCAEALGFCFFNNVALAAAYARQHLGVGKVVILDWDVHHGNGTQNILFHDPTIMYISLHRHDNGAFYPFTGELRDAGISDGEGFNINVPWNGGKHAMGNTEYLAAFEYVLLPILKDYAPDLILISAGYDAAEGDQLGGYHVRPECYAHMTKRMMELVNDKVVLALEGGYDLDAITGAAVASLATLQGTPPPVLNPQINRTTPVDTASSTLRQVIRFQSKFWPSLRSPGSFKLPDHYFDPTAAAEYASAFESQNAVRNPADNDKTGFPAAYQPWSAQRALEGLQIHGRVLRSQSRSSSPMPQGPPGSDAVMSPPVDTQMSPSTSVTSPDETSGSAQLSAPERPRLRGTRSRSRSPAPE